MADDMRGRREKAAAAFTARRGELGLTQEDVARRAEIVVKTVYNFENGRWPNRRTRERLELAVEWAPGEIDRIADPEARAADRPSSETAIEALDRLQRELDLLREHIRQTEKKGNGDEGNGRDVA